MKMQYLFMVLMLFCAWPVHAGDAPPPVTVCAAEENCETEDPSLEEPHEPVMCTMDAKLCPDGSYVSRQGPHCEFAPCPREAEDLDSK